MQRHPQHLFQLMHIHSSENKAMYSYGKGKYL